MKNEAKFQKKLTKVMDLFDELLKDANLNQADTLHRTSTSLGKAAAGIMSREFMKEPEDRKE